MKLYKVYVWYVFLFLILQSGCGDGCVRDSDAGPFAPNYSGRSMVLTPSGWILDMSQCSDPTRAFCYIEEFKNSLANCTTIESMTGAASGTGAGCTANATTTASSFHPGVLSMATGTTATGGVRGFTLPGGIDYGGGAGEFCVGFNVQFPTLSTTTIEYLARFGANEPTSNADSVDAVQLVYDRAAKGNFWAFEIRSNSVNATGTPLALDGTGGTCNAPITAGNIDTGVVCVDSGGANATAFVNGVQCATVSTGIPTGTTRTTGIGMQCFNNNGGTPASELCNIDYMASVINFLVPR